MKGLGRELNYLITAEIIIIISINVLIKDIYRLPQHHKLQSFKIFNLMDGPSMDGF